LQCADHFIENVVYKASKLAKNSGGSSIQPKDLLFVLEKNWGIRVSGYFYDSLGTVCSPVAAHTAKVSSIYNHKKQDHDKMV
jgi:transcription initiation factor TFIID subunit TAF12